MRYSVIIPVYNRPDELQELLASLCSQNRSMQDVEVLVVEDGSSLRCENIVDAYRNKLNIDYFYKDNSGPGHTRNCGASRAQGEYLIILDSDVVLPQNYFNAIDKELANNPCDAFGGPDRAHKDFSAVQKAISYAMTSFFTTGGIRGGKHKMDKFYPRSFNMGIRKDVYTQLGGFSRMRFGEDIDLSIRIFKQGYNCRLFPNAWVWHKRRTDLKKFFKQVHNSGIARINLFKRHPESLKAVHLLPAAFTLCTIMLLLGCIWCAWSITPLVIYAFIILIDAGIKERSLWVGVLSIAASFTQLIGYGTGFILAWWKRIILRQPEFSAYQHTFYK